MGAFSEFMRAGAAEMQQVAGVAVELHRRGGCRVVTTAVIAVQSAALVPELSGREVQEVGHGLLPPAVSAEPGDFLVECASGRRWYVAGVAFSPHGDVRRVELVRYARE